MVGETIRVEFWLAAWIMAPGGVGATAIRPARREFRRSAFVHARRAASC
ncbi:MAG: hypothetical protein MJA27_36685 [Pseudanabaenales cyanobacterium]|nr:hypothetical protein [Pseudanabaenales cyanobacterium]